VLTPTFFLQFPSVAKFPRRGQGKGKEVGGRRKKKEKKKPLPAICTLSVDRVGFRAGRGKEGERGGKEEGFVHYSCPSTGGLQLGKRGGEKRGEKIFFSCLPEADQGLACEEKKRRGGRKGRENPAVTRGFCVAQLGLRPEGRKGGKGGNAAWPPNLGCSFFHSSLVARHRGGGKKKGKRVHFAQSGLEGREKEKLVTSFCLY